MLPIGILVLLGPTGRVGDFMRWRKGRLNLSGAFSIQFDFGHYLSLGGKTRSLVFMEGKSKKLIRDIQGINFSLEAQCPSVELVGSWDKLDRT